MLIPSRLRRAHAGRRHLLLAALLNAPLALLPARPLLAAEPAAAAMPTPRPADLVLLQQRQSLRGEERIGVYGAKADPQAAGLWSVQVWVETSERVTVATDRIRCHPSAPLRITGSSGRVLMRQLNPGGPIFPANRLDHLIWWAVCHPTLAGRDPAGLGAEARRLGYSGLIQEQQQLLPGP
jgi:hypothetical protein